MQTGNCPNSWAHNPATQPCSALVLPCSWLPTLGHSPGHISYLHNPSGTLIAGDALFNMLPSFSWAGGIEVLLTRPLRWAAAPAARMALAPARGLLGDRLAGLNDTLGLLSTERLAASAVSHRRWLR